jgi:hypothetical protein
MAARNNRGRLDASTFLISSDEEGESAVRVSDNIPNTATKRKQQRKQLAGAATPMVRKKAMTTVMAVPSPEPAAGPSGDEAGPKKPRNRFGEPDPAVEWLKQKKAAAAAAASASGSQDDEPFSQLANDGFDVSESFVVESNLPAPSQNVDFLIAKFRKSVFVRLREVEPLRGNGFTIDVPITENENENQQKFVCVKLFPKFHKTMSKAVPTMEAGWNPGMYPVRTMVSMRTGFVDSKEQNSTILELTWQAMLNLEQEGKKFMLWFDRKIKGKEFQTIEEIPLPPPAVIQVIPRIQRGVSSVGKKGNQVMLTMEAKLFPNSKGPKLQFNIRSYYWDSDEKWKPSRQGITVQHKAFLNIVKGFIPLVSDEFIEGLEKLRVGWDHKEDEIDDELKALTYEQKNKLVYNEEIEFEENDDSQPIIDDHADEFE